MQKFIYPSVMVSNVGGQGVPHLHKSHGHGSLHTALLPGKSRGKSLKISDFYEKIFCQEKEC
jgi:hypothetical protein